MAKMQALPATVRDMVKQAAEGIVDRLYGEGGSPPIGTRFTEVEDIGVEVGDSLARVVMQLAMERQAAAMEGKPCQCSCGSPVAASASEPRTMTTRRGEIGWNEPSGHCSPCRRAFFPSGPGIGPEAG
jgi:hypothetical protein